MLIYLSKAVCIIPCIKKLVTNVVANSRVVMVDERSGDDVQCQHLIEITAMQGQQFLTMHIFYANNV